MSQWQACASVVVGGCWCHGDFGSAWVGPRTYVRTYAMLLGWLSSREFALADTTSVDGMGKYAYFLAHPNTKMMTLTHNAQVAAQQP